MLTLTQPWLTSEASQSVCRALSGDGATVYFVGGCVRNALLEEPVSDLDLSTNLHPKEVLARAQKAGIKAVPTGLDHGTVTLVANDTPFEVTTFRKDIETDGRRAVVSFSDNMEDDAKRRDFTMNALYADQDGRIHDPLGAGLSDLSARRVRFIGTAEHRIQEDYLRILRYFRFYAWYGNPANGLDPDALAAIAANLDGLLSLSRERVTHEILKLLAAPDPAPSVAGMRQSGVLATLFSGADDRALAPLVHLEACAGLGGHDPILRLAALGDPAKNSHNLRLSKAQSRRLHLLRDMASGAHGAAELAYRFGMQDARGMCTLRAALLEGPLEVDLDALLAQGAAASFPVSAQDLIQDLSGAALGAALKRLETAWIKSGFTLDRTSLLRLLD